MIIVCYNKVYLFYEITMREIKFRAWDTANKKFQEIETIEIARNDRPTSINSWEYQIQSNWQIILLQFTWWQK